MSVDSFFWLDQIQPYHRDRVGSKAFYLAVLQQRGYPVIPGLVVGSDRFQTFLHQVEWADPTFADLPASSLYVDVDNPRQLQAAAQQIRQAIVSTPFPEDWLLSLKQAIGEWQVDWPTEAVILRPSFSLAAGLDPTVSSQTQGLLDAKVCRAEPQAIAQTIKQVWAELFRARSLLYWQRLGIQPQQVQLAVLIQPLQASIAAGEAIVRGGELEVQAVWGLGHGMAQGVPADSYRVDATGTVHVDRVSRKTVAYTVAMEMPDQAMPDQAMPDQIRSRSFPFGVDDYLQMQGLQPEQQTQPVLTQEQVERLARLCHQLTIALDMTVKLEWILCAPAGAAEPVFYITQVIPYSRRASKAALVSSGPVAPPAASNTPEAASGSPVNSTAIPPSGNREAADFPDKHPASQHFQGIAAAPGTVAATVWVIPETASLRDMPPGCILVAPMILPEWVGQLRQVAGMVTERGGITSHGAILARELGIPAVVGVANAMQVLQTGERVLVNGDRGEVVQMMSDPEAANPQPQEQLQPGSQLAPANRPDSENETLDEARPRSMPPTATRLMVSLSQTESIAQIHELPIDGVGLLRSELLWLQSLDQRSPEEWLQQDQPGLVDRLAHQIQQLADRMMPRPVFYRSLDVRTHEFPVLAAPSGVEANPMLGLRGTYRYQTHPAWFEVELAALRQVQRSGYDNLRLILPFVRTVEEFTFCRERVQQAGLQQPSFELWIMAEVPSVLLLLPAYIKAGVQGLAIGCNDLTQLLLGVDRDHPQLAAQFNMTHPAVMEAIRQIIQTCRSAGLPCTLCGQLPTRLDIIERLVEWGVTGISVEPGALSWVSEAIDRAERRLLLERERGQ